MINIGNYKVIADIGHTIINILRKEMVPNPIPKNEMIELVSPENIRDYRLILYLYSIKENIDSMNSVDYNDLSLSLFYLMSVSSNADIKSKAYDEYCILGKAMSTMRENTFINGSKLVGSLAQSNENLNITLCNLSNDEMSKIWIFPNVSYKLSIAYMVSPVYISSSKNDDISNLNRVGMG